MRLKISPLGVVLAGWLAGTAPAAAEKLRVQATLVELPRTPACSTRTLRVLAIYRLERVLAGGPLRERTVAVMHRCPEQARGPARIGRGSAPPLRPGQTHLMDLEPYRGELDAAPEAPAVARYPPRLTALAPPPPLGAVLGTGPSRATVRLDFDAETVTVGRAADSDVLLNHREVALRQLLLEVRGERLFAVDLQQGTARVNRVPLRGERAVTHRDTISVGPYSLKVSLFLASELASLD
jgi:hypothetical protein